MVLFLKLSLLVTLLLAASTLSQELAPHLCSGKLPSPRYSVAPVFDGEDSIYLFGGDIQDAPATDEILKYSISHDTIEVVGTLPVPDYGGVATINHNTKEMFWFGSAYYRPIYRFDPHSGKSDLVGNLPTSFHYSSLVKPDNQTAFLISEITDREAIKFDMEHLTVDTTNELPLLHFVSKGAVWDEEDNELIVLGQSKGGTVKYALKYSSLTGEAETQLVENLEDGGGGWKTFWDGEKVYFYKVLFTGNGAIGQYDPETNSVKYLDLQEFPGISFTNLRNAGHVYVRKLNRLYIFGGYADTVAQRLDQIYYIDLSPVNGAPTTTSRPTTTKRPKPTRTTKKPKPTKKSETL